MSKEGHRGTSFDNGVGFHSPQESMRILGDSANQTQQARLLAKKGVAAKPKYPDLSTPEKAWDVASSLLEGKGANLLP